MIRAPSYYWRVVSGEGESETVAGSPVARSVTTFTHLTLSSLVTSLVQQGWVLADVSGCMYMSMGRRHAAALHHRVGRGSRATCRCFDTLAG